MKKETILQLKFVKNSMIIEDVHIMGIGPLKFLVTTDSPTTLLDKSLANKLELKLEGPLKGIGAGGEAPYHITKLNSLIMGGISLKNLQVAVFDFSQISDKLGLEICGAIASDLLKKCKAVIDYGNEQLTLSKPTLIKKMKDTTIGFNLVKRIIILPIYVNHVGPLNFALDIGAGASVISKSTAEKLGLKGLQKRYGMGAGGELTLQQTTVNHLMLGEIEIENFRIFITDLSALSSKLGQELNGILGYDVLNYFEVTINYKKKQVRLKQERKLIPPKATMEDARAVAISSKELTPELLQLIKKTGKHSFTLDHLPPQLKKLLEKKQD